MKDEIEALCEEITQLNLENTHLKAEVERLRDRQEPTMTEKLGLLDRLQAQEKRRREALKNKP